MLYRRIGGSYTACCGRTAYRPAPQPRCYTPEVATAIPRSAACTLRTPMSHRRWPKQWKRGRSCTAKHCGARARQPSHSTMQPKPKSFSTKYRRINYRHAKHCQGRRCGQITNGRRHSPSRRVERPLAHTACMASSPSDTPSPPNSSPVHVNERRLVNDY